VSDTISFIKFTKTGEIGSLEGKNSHVFLAKDDQLGVELVIKQLDKKKFKSEEYFLESKMLYNCKHPNIVEIQYASQDKDNIYLAMPYYSKGSLNTLAKHRYLTVREIIKYSLDLLSGISYIHSKRLVHLDIKPTNILIDTTGRALLTDFGLSKYLDENGIADQPNTYLVHADPEWYQHSGRDVQSDIYQIGLTIYRLCNGIDILQNTLRKQGITNQDSLRIAVLKGKFPDRKNFLPHIPKKLQKIVLKALEVDHTKRYQNTIELMNDLSTIDCSLDWIYTGDNNTPYTKITEEYRYDINVNTKINHIECLRKKLSTGKATKVKGYCLDYSSEHGDLDKKLSEIVGGID